MPRRILVVDDEKDVLGAFRRSLELDGYTVSTAESGAEALKLCEETSYDVVILDFIMPRMDGIQLLIRIRKLQPHIRSVIISGQLKAEVDERRLGRELGEWVEADVYLHKPISAAKLAETVTSLLNTADSGDWRSLAEQAVKGHKVTLTAAKKASKSLSAHKKSKE
jgi:CheY-like chemotaxis protein